MEKIRVTYPSVLLITALVIFSLVAAYLVANVGIFVGPVIALSLIGILVVGMMFKDYIVGVYVAFAVCVFMSFISRIFRTDFPFGVVIDAVICITFVIMLFNIRERERWSVIKSPITYIFTAIVVYQLLEVFNPDAVSVMAWVVALRNYTVFLLFFIFFQLFLSFENIKKFTILWIGLATIVAIYGIYQELFGLTGGEASWLYSNPGRVQLYLIWGHLRKFSFLSDPSAFGLFMAFSALGAYALMLGPFKGIYKLLFGIVGTLMLISMSYSGTRTATAMVAIGMVFYILVTLRNRKTLIVMVFAGIAGLALMFGPFYGGTVNRIRSTFEPGNDASMSVRDIKRVNFQPYVQSHPIGGGINTLGRNGSTYSRGHRLSGWDADSGYLTTALEIGWIGLALTMLLFGAVMIKGINNNFSMKDPLLKTLNLAYIVPFIAMSVAHFTQDAMFQKPGYLVIIATYALVLTLPTYEKDYRHTKKEF